MSNPNLIIHVANNSVMCLYEWEMSGQISDGKYENSRPFDHWRWVNDVLDIVKDSKSGISATDDRIWKRFGYYPKMYNINEWTTYINGFRKGSEKYRNYGWATRAIAFAKFGKIYPDINYATLRSLSEIRVFLEDLQMMIDCGNTDAEDLFKKLTDWTNKDWRKKYYESCKEYLTPEFIEKYLTLQYDVKELKVDLKLLSDAVNNKF